MIGMTVCSGIGAPEVAAPWVSWRYACEIAPFPAAVLAARHPGQINLGDMTEFEEWPDVQIDILCGGTPCQDASIGYAAGSGVAGRGLAGDRSGLAFAYVGIARRYRPRVLVWENVPNLLSGRLAGGFLGFARALAGLGYCLAWRIVDAADHGLADQPRPRLFLVGYPRDARFGASVLLEPEGDRRHRAPRAPAAPVLTARGGMAFDDRTPCILEDYGPRIATPLEWERAMGFPDNYTAIAWRGRPAELCPDGPRYAALGNSMSVPVMRWVFNRIAAAIGDIEP